MLRLSWHRSFQVKEITLNLAPHRAWIAQVCISTAKQVSDSIQVQKLAFGPVQERIKPWWGASDKDAIEISYTKTWGKKYEPECFENGGNQKTLLRSRYLLGGERILVEFCPTIRANILFREDAQIKKNIYLSVRYDLIFLQVSTRIKHWHTWHAGMTGQTILSFILWYFFQNDSCALS